MTTSSPDGRRVLIASLLCLPGTLLVAFALFVGTGIIDTPLGRNGGLLLDLIVYLYVLPLHLLCLLAIWLILRNRSSIAGSRIKLFLNILNILLALPLAELLGISVISRSAPLVLAILIVGIVLFHRRLALRGHGGERKGDSGVDRSVSEPAGPR